MKIQFSLGLLGLCLVLLGSVHASDLVNVTSVPGIPESNFNVYAGYIAVNLNVSMQLYYILTESQSSPSTDPLIVMIGGGPCKPLDSESQTTHIHTI